MKYLVLVCLLVLVGCSSSGDPRGAYGSSNSELPQSERTVCKDGHCWRVKDTGHYIGTDGVALPLEK